MSSLTIAVKDEAVQAELQKLAARVNDMAPVLDTIGTGIIARTRRRFGTSTGPDGVQWEKNSAATLAMLSDSIGRSKSNRKKDGSLNARGGRMLANKKPLIGPTGLLGTMFHSLVVGNTLTVNSPFVYSAIHQFGGKAGRGLKVNIPARPYLPIRQDGTLYDEEQAEILKAINEYLMDQI